MERLCFFLVLFFLVEVPSAGGMLRGLSPSRIFRLSNPISVSDVRFSGQADLLAHEDPLLRSELEVFCQHLNARMEQVKSEQQSIWSANVDSMVSNIAARLCSLDVSSPSIGANMWRVMRELVNLCEKCPPEALKVVKATTDFDFCWGVVAYYANNGDGFKELKKYFSKYTQRQMTRANGLELLRGCESENAYVFLGGLGNEG